MSMPFTAANELSHIFSFNDEDLVDNRLNLLGAHQTIKLQEELDGTRRRLYQLVYGTLGLIAFILIYGFVSRNEQVINVSSIVLVLGGLLSLSNYLELQSLKADFTNRRVEIIESQRVFITHLGNTRGWKDYVQVGSNLLKISTLEAHALHIFLKRQPAGVLRIYYLPKTKRVVAAEK